MSISGYGVHGLLSSVGKDKRGSVCAHRRYSTLGEQSDAPIEGVFKTSGFLP
jgi:hypothetical protein